MSVTDQSPDAVPFPPLPQRRPTSANGAAGQPSGSQSLPRRRPSGSDSTAESGLPRRLPAGSESSLQSGLPRRSPGGADNGPGASLPRRSLGGRPRRVGRHRSLHRISVASDAPALILAVPGRWESAADLARQVAETTAESCPGVSIKVGYLGGVTDTLAEALAHESRHSQANGRLDDSPQAVVVPLLAGPHPVIDRAIAAAITSARTPVMLGAALGPH